MNAIAIQTLPGHAPGREPFPTEYRITPKGRLRHAALALLSLVLGGSVTYVELSGPASLWPDMALTLLLVAAWGVPLVLALAGACGPGQYVQLSETGFVYYALFRRKHVAWNDVLSAHFLRRNGQVWPVYKVRHWRGPEQWPTTLRIGLGNLSPAPREFEAAFTHYWRKATREQGRTAAG